MFEVIYYTELKKRIRKLSLHHEKIIRKYKNLLFDVFRTDFYQWLKGHYVPKVIKFDKETGRANVVIAQGLPDKEAMIYSFSLLRQFLLKKDDISIYRIGKHIKKLGSEKNYNTYISYFIKFEKYANDRSGAIYSRIDEMEMKIEKITLS